MWNEALKWLKLIILLVLVLLIAFKQIESIKKVGFTKDIAKMNYKIIKMLLKGIFIIFNPI